MYQNPIEHLSHDEISKRLINTVALLQQIQRALSPHLPENIANQLSVIKLEQETLVLALPSAHFVQRVKSAYPLIIETLKQHNILIKNIQLKILPSSSTLGKKPLNLPPKNQPARLSEAALVAFRDLETQTSHNPDLNQAIQRILSRRKT